MTARPRSARLSRALAAIVPTRLQARPERLVLSDLRQPTLSIVCEPCGRRGRYSEAKLKERHGGARLTDLLHTLAACGGDGQGVTTAAPGAGLGFVKKEQEEPMAPPRKPRRLRRARTSPDSWCSPIEGTVFAFQPTRRRHHGLALSSAIAASSIGSCTPSRCRHTIVRDRSFALLFKVDPPRPSPIPVLALGAKPAHPAQTPHGASIAANPPGHASPPGDRVTGATGGSRRICSVPGRCTASGDRLLFMLRSAPRRFARTAVFVL
jgi:hypothetical protein